MKNLQADIQTRPSGSPIRIAFVFGTRPEAVKMAVPVLRAKYDPRFQPIVLSTGQHQEMMQPILNFFGIQPDVDLHLMKPGQSLTEFVANAMIRLREEWQSKRPDIVCIQGDTATCAAAAIAAFFEKIPLAHIEAGLRTHDLMSPFPEEYNRKLVALTARWNFAPTKQAQQNLISEGVATEKIQITGNTGIDALLSVRERLTQDPASEIRFQEKFPAVAKARRENKKIVLVTTHRRESFGEPLRETLRALSALSRRSDVEIFGRSPSRALGLRSLRMDDESGNNHFDGLWWRTRGSSVIGKTSPRFARKNGTTRSRRGGNRFARRNRLSIDFGKCQSFAGFV